MKLEGKMSIFGGPDDSGMTFTEGLSLFEHEEADQRPDLFKPRSENVLEGSSKRLREGALYIAIRFSREDKTRKWWQNSLWKVINPKNGKWVVASLCDWGPNERTLRVADLSPLISTLLSLNTDDVVEVECLSF